MNKLVFIVGPTATGKTNIAIKIAKHLNGDIISADSRQVYKHMTIGSGKDIPSHAVQRTIKISGYRIPINVYLIPETTLWGFDTVNPTEEWSAAHFYHYSTAVIKHLVKNQRLPIIVGGTGFYSQSIYSPPASLGIAPNQTLRIKLAKLSLEKLQDKLKSINSDRFESLNHSDQCNPRRLTRAIEIAMNNNPTGQTRNNFIANYKSLWIGLDAPNSYIDQRIEERVDTRLKQGFEAEVDFLIKEKLLGSHLQAASATGYKQWIDYKQGKITRSEAIKQWITAEKQYARRQKTWFKKQPHITWFDTHDKSAENLVVEYAKNWYAKN